MEDGPSVNCRKFEEGKIVHACSDLSNVNPFPYLTLVMESLNNTEWDVVIAGTGLAQSLLALALSRSGKRILHIDQNGWYGGPEAALSLQEVKEWVDGIDSSSTFRDANISQPEPEVTGPKLSPSRAYSLALAPHLIYTESQLLKKLVSSKLDRQVEFLALGSWWVYTKNPEDQGNECSGSDVKPERFIRVPTSREDLAFSDTSIDLRSKRALMKILRFIADFENQPEVWEEYQDQPLHKFLSEMFKLPSKLVDLFLALSLSCCIPEKTKTAFALPRIARHLRSTGKLGPGFSSVIPKWGGLSEIAQVSCRAGAVGGTVYVLNNGITAVRHLDELNDDHNQNFSLELSLSNGDLVRTKRLVGSTEDLPRIVDPSNDLDPSTDTLHRSIAIVSSALQFLFPAIPEGAPPPAGAMVVFPAGTLSRSSEATDTCSPVYLILHSSDTGECPKGQSVIYAATSAGDPNEARELLTQAIQTLLRCYEEQPVSILWSVQYSQEGRDPTDEESPETQEKNQAICFAQPSLDLSFDDSVLDRVRDIWRTIMTNDLDDSLNMEDFLVFGDRKGEVDEEDDDYL